MRGPACTSDDAHACACSYHRWLHHDEPIEPPDHDEEKMFVWIRWESRR